MILDRVNYPHDLRALNIDELKTLASEIRELMVKKVNTTGGHFGPNFGVVELTIALHRVFDCPKDKLVFDVSHQCYPHKILTGRKEGFIDPDKYLKYTGYTAPQESEYDIFTVGHTATSVSLATGLAKSRDLKGETHNVIALIGDGSLSGGEAYEGLNNASDLKSNIIIVVNDNDMSIAENHGGLYGNLKLLRDTKGQAECNFFKSLGFDYLYVDEGNNIEELIQAFEKVKYTKNPTVVHVKTLKGCGVKVAEENKEKFHWILPHTLDENKPLQTECEDYNSVTTDFILRKAKEDKTLVAITAATPGATGFYPEFRHQLGKQYVDVGIAEEHAIAFASALAKDGSRPILGILSSFVQRTYDQISQDLCLNKSPMTILVYWGGISGADCTHLGSFDMSMLGNIPNLVYLAPTNKEEYLAMLEWSTTQNEHPVAIRVPFAEFISTGVEDKTDYSKLNKFELCSRGEKVAILGLGNFFGLAQNLKTALKEKSGINATLINPKFITGIDEELLNSLKSDHKIVVTLEDGNISGGFGEKIARFYGNSEMKTLCYGSKKEFTDRADINELYKRYRLTVSQLVEDISNVL